MNEAAQLFKALSDDTRLRIMGLLINGELCVCDLMAVLGLPQSTVSRHLAYLKHSGLVSDRREGTWMHYRLITSDNPLYNDLLDLLRKNIAEMPRIRDDREALRKNISLKLVRSCCAPGDD